MNFEEHVSKLCKNLMSHVELRLNLKSFIESNFSYCPLVWMFHSRSLNNCIKRLHERGLRLIYKDPSLSFDELLRLFLYTIETYRSLLLKCIKHTKIIYQSLVKSIFPTRQVPNWEITTHFNLPISILFTIEQKLF